MNEIIVTRVEDWKEKYVSKDQKMQMTKEISDIITDAILAYIFGKDQLEVKLPYLIEEDIVDMKLGTFLRMILYSTYTKRTQTWRKIVDMFDDFDISEEEEEQKENCIEFRNYIIKMIKERREQMKQPNYQSQGDFLSQLLQTDLFKETDEYMIDEVMTLIGTSVIDITCHCLNALAQLNLNKDKLALLR